MFDEPWSVMVNVHKTLAAAPTFGAQLQTIASAALRLTGGDHASVRLCDQDGTLRVGARVGIGAGSSAPSFRKGIGIMGWVAETQSVARVDDATLDSRFRVIENRGFPMRSILSLPLSAQGESLGVLSVSAARPQVFNSAVETQSRVLAGTAAQAIRVAELRHLAMMDTHTQSYNRRYLHPRLQEEMSRAGRTGEALSVLMLDLDHFKQVNDVYGHAVGDAVLVAFTDLVRDCVRNVDLLFRRGGEEFVLILPNTDGYAALAVAQRVRERLARRPLVVRQAAEQVTAEVTRWPLGDARRCQNGGAPTRAPRSQASEVRYLADLAQPSFLVSQTVSIGVAVWDGGEGPVELETRADHAMYAAKARGRNRVILSHPELSTSQRS